MTDDELEANYHHCANCGIAPCDCGEPQDTHKCAACSFCAIESDEEENP